MDIWLLQNFAYLHFRGVSDLLNFEWSDHSKYNTILPDLATSIYCCLQTVIVCLFSIIYFFFLFFCLSSPSSPLIQCTLYISKNIIIIIISLPLFKGEYYCFCHYSSSASSFFLHVRICPGHISETARSFSTKF